MSNRLTDYRYAEAIQRALYYMPAPIIERVRHVHYFTGTDPLWAGVVRAETTADGRSYRDTACCCYSYLAPDGRTTVVLPTPKDADPWVITHELGHVLHEVIGFDYVAEPTTAYSHANHWEAFAESFTAWLGRYWSYDIWPHPRDAAFFGALP